MECVSYILSKKHRKYMGKRKFQKIEPKEKLIKRLGDK